MEIKCLFFAQCANWVDKKEMVLTLPHAISIDQLLTQQAHLAPLQKRKSFLKVAVNHALVNYDTEVQDGDEVAFMPPYSGG